MRFFFYGTLMDRDLLSMVAGLSLPAGALVPATLAGYRRARARGRDFPLLVIRPSGSVDGVVVEGLAEEAVLRLVWYERDGHTVVRRPTLLGDGQTVASWMFLARPGLLEAGPAWSFEDWQRRHKGRAVGALERAIWDGAPSRAELAAARVLWERRRGR